MIGNTNYLILPYITGILLAITALSACGQAAWPPDDNQLKAYLMGEFIAFEGYDRAITRRLKDGGVTDEQLRRVLVSVYAEAEAAHEQAKDQYERMVSTLRRENAIYELGVCADAETKGFLLDVAADATKDDFLRTIAVSSYLHIADAQEAKEILTRFLVGNDKMDSDSRSSILRHAHTVYIEADLEKKRAIIESLHVTLANEDAKWLFRVYDNILSRLSQQYADSRQMRDILKRLINATPTCLADELALPDLKARLTQLQKFTPITNITTNLKAINSRDFSQPPPGGDAVAADASPASHLPPHAPAATPLRGFWLYAIGGVVVLSMATEGVWM